MERCELKTKSCQNVLKIITKTELRAWLLQALWLVYIAGVVRLSRVQIRLLQVTI